MSKHTPGPLTLYGHDLYFAHRAGGFSLRGCPSPEENARRIAACWNLLAAFTTEEIEQWIDIVSLVRQRDEALQELQREHVLRVRLAGELDSSNQQRDELLAALHDAATSLETIQLRSFGQDSFLDSKPEMRSYAGSRAAVAREAIDKAKGVAS